MGNRRRKSSSRDSSEENYRSKKYMHDLEKEVSYLKRKLEKQTRRHDDTKRPRRSRESGKERLRAPNRHHSVESSRSSQRLSAFDSRENSTLPSHRSRRHGNNQSTTESSDDEHAFLENGSQFDPSENHGTPVENDNAQGDTEEVALVNEETIDEEVMEVLGEVKIEEKAFELHSVLKKRWLEILNQGLAKEERSQLLNKHVPPSNLRELKAPEVNLEILSALPENAIKNDKFHVSRQVQLSKGLAALGMAMNLLLKAQPAEVVNIKNNILANLSEAGKILGDLHYRMSLSRRALLVPHLNKTVKDVTTKMPVDELLFGSNLGEKN